MKVMQTRIMLTPYDPKKRLRLIIDGAKTVGTGFVLCQYINEDNPSKGVNIIHAGADKFEPGKIYSPVEAEAIALSRAIEECHHWILYSDPVMLFSDCSGLLEMIEKPLAYMKNLLSFSTTSDSLSDVKLGETHLNHQFLPFSQCFHY